MHIKNFSSDIGSKKSEIILVSSKIVKILTHPFLKACGRAGDVSRKASEPTATICSKFQVPPLWTATLRTP
jgi:hypothetical protein